MVNDALSDFLARLKNASLLRSPFVEIPQTRMVLAVAQLLKKEGYLTEVKKFKIGGRNKLHLGLAAGSPLTIFRRFSKPSRRLYRRAALLPRSSRGGLVIVTTSRGIMSSRQAKRLSLGGELLMEVG